MEKFQEAREKAERSIRVADHMLFVTYPLIQDDKLLISILENVFLAMSQSMASVLYYERLFKRVHPFHDNFESKYTLFKEKIAPRYKIERKYLKLMRTVHEIILEHRKSPMEFTRRGKFVICSGDYQTKTISFDDLKDFVRTAKVFLTLNKRIVEKNGFIFKRS